MVGLGFIQFKLRHFDFAVDIALLGVFNAIFEPHVTFVSHSE